MIRFSVVLKALLLKKKEVRKMLKNLPRIATLVEGINPQHLIGIWISPSNPETDLVRFTPFKKEWQDMYEVSMPLTRLSELLNYLSSLTGEGLFKREFGDLCLSRQGINKKGVIILDFFNIGGITVSIEELLNKLNQVGDNYRLWKSRDRI